jgi:hypothetical protein
VRDGGNGGIWAGTPYLITAGLIAVAHVLSSCALRVDSHRT